MRAPQLLVRSLAACVAACVLVPVASAQESSSPFDQTSTVGFTLPDSDRLRVTIDVLAAYTQDRANTQLGLERQGRVGYAIITATGRLNSRITYRLAINPVNETQPLPGCGVAGYFFPNDPTTLYGASTTVPCNPQFGDRRVDEYRGIALDVVGQQGPIREGYADMTIVPGLSMRFGRMQLPVGFDWQDAGSFTAKDALRIQRINAQDNFGAMLSYVSPLHGRRRPQYTGHAAMHLGDSNRWWDYDYYYFEDGAFGTNSQVTTLLSGSYAPVDALEIRASYQHGGTGSKVERLPSYWASKRNDDAVLIGAEYRPLPGLRMVAEHADYIWGPTATSAAMLHMDPRPIHKKGEYMTLEYRHGLARLGAMGGSLSVERLARADSLVKYMIAQGNMDVTSGQYDRMLVARLFVDLGKQTEIGLFHTSDSNPFPWLSGMSPVSGPKAFSKVSTNKWGIVTRLSVR